MQKEYTPAERKAAQAKLPKQVSGFLDSDAIALIYQGLVEKHRLNLRQADLLANIANTTLLGLEPESALETNLHQALPELPAHTLRELVVDVNDRIFKEARRRLQEDILEPGPEEWDEEELGPKTEAAAKLLSDEELDKLAEKEEKEGWKPPEEEEPAPQAAPIALPQSGAATPTVLNTPLPDVQAKLAVPVQVKAETVSVKPQTSGIRNIQKAVGGLLVEVKEKPNPEGVASAPKETKPPAATSPASQPPAAYKSNDPYREAPE